MSKWHGLNRNKTPNKYSLKKIIQLNSEVEARIALCKRAKGTPVLSKEIYKRNDGKTYIIRRVRCVGGICECSIVDKRNNCGGKRGDLEPHETPRKRSQGAKISLKESIMVLRECHKRLDGRNPKLHWIN